MARTYRNLWPGLVAWENLLTAYRLCRRRKRYKPDACRFHYDWERSLRALQGELTDGTYRPGPYRHFFIYEPKRRKISAAPFRDRIVHHAVVRLLEPIFEPRFIFDSYACRRGKGTHAALDRAQQFLRRHRYYLKTDIVRYYPNVDHGLLLEVLGRRAGDPRVLELIGIILDSGKDILAEEATPSYFPGDDLVAVLRPKGLPIGNLTSQFFANVLLDQVDHFAKETLRVPAYVRYADDLVLFGDHKSELWACRSRLADFLAGLRLRLHTDKTCIAPSPLGLKFLGLVLHREGRRLQQSAIKKFNARLRRFRHREANGNLDFASITRSLRAWLAHANGTNSTGIRRELWRRLRFQRALAR